MQDNQLPPIGLNPKTYKSFKVMVVDDSVTIRMMLKQILLSEKFDVILEAGDGFETLTKVAPPNIPDLICIDVEMPNKSGIETVQELKVQYPDIKVVMVTSHSDSSIVSQLLRLKVDGYIIKPFNRKLVVDKLRTIVQRMVK